MCTNRMLSNLMGTHRSAVVCSSICNVFFWQNTAFFLYSVFRRVVLLSIATSLPCALERDSPMTRSIILSNDILAFLTFWNSWTVSIAKGAGSDVSPNGMHSVPMQWLRCYLFSYDWFDRQDHSWFHMHAFYKVPVDFTIVFVNGHLVITYLWWSQALSYNHSDFPQTQCSLHSTERMADLTPPTDSRLDDDKESLVHTLKTYYTY